MKRIGVRELRQHASRYLDLVKAGESVEVTERGELIAILCPPTSDAVRRDRLAAAGILVLGRRGDLGRPVAVGEDEPSNAMLLDDERADRV